MYWRSNPPTQPTARDVWEDRRPTIFETTSRSTADVSPATPSLTGTRHLVVTNGADDRAEVLLAVAGRLAEQSSAVVHVTYLQTPLPPGDLESLRLLAPLHTDGFTADSYSGMYRMARDLSVRTGLPVLPEILIGPADPTLSDYMRSNEFELVTMAAPESWFTYLSKGLWSDVARWRPVLIVGPKVRRSWADEESSTREVLAVLDGTTAAESILPWAAALCQRRGGRLTLLRISRADRDGESVDACHQYLVGVGRRLRRQIDDVRTVVATGRPAEAVLALQQATGAILAVATPRRSWFTALTPGRLIGQLLRESTSPVLFFRPSR